MHRSSNNSPGYPHGRLSVVKHRQLPCQVGAFGAIAIKSSTNFNNMIFPKGSIFIFRSWVCEVDDEGNLQGCLVETLEACEELTLPTKLTEDLAERLTVSESTQTPMTTSLNLTSGLDSPSESYLGSFKDKPSFFSNWTLNHGINSIRDQFKSTLGFFWEVESSPNQTEQHGKDISRFTPKHG
jgi:hypothetical protein